jgi:hypothetical protein
MNKPDVLSDEELRKRAIVYFRVEKGMDIKVVNIDLGFLKQELQAQRDADVAYYEPIIQQKTEESEARATLLMAMTDKCLALKTELQQAEMKGWREGNELKQKRLDIKLKAAKAEAAREEVAREIERMGFYDSPCGKRCLCIPEDEFKSKYEEKK